MNPWALVVIGLGVLVLIMGVTGSYSEVKQALTGNPAKSTDTSPTGPATPAPKLPRIGSFPTSRPPVQ